MPTIGSKPVGSEQVPQHHEKKDLISLGVLEFEDKTPVAV